MAFKQLLFKRLLTGFASALSPPALHVDMPAVWAGPASRGQGMLPFFGMQGTGLWEPSRALCTAWAQHVTQQFCTSCLASSFQLTPAFTPSKTWAFKPPKGVQGGWENASHIYRGGWAYSFCFKGCNFAESRTERLSTCRQLRVTITRLYRSIEEFPVLCMCLLFVYRT